MEDIGRIYDGNCVYDITENILIHDAGPFSGYTCTHKFGDEKALIEEIKKNQQDKITEHKNKLLDIKKDIIKIQNVINNIVKSNLIDVKLDCPLHFFRFLEIPSKKRKIYNIGYNFRDNDIFITKNPVNYEAYDCVKYA